MSPQLILVSGIVIIPVFMCFANIFAYYVAHLTHDRSQNDENETEVELIPVKPRQLVREPIVLPKDPTKLSDAYIRWYYTEHQKEKLGGIPPEL